MDGIEKQAREKGEQEWYRSRKTNWGLFSRVKKGWMSDCEVWRETCQKRENTKSGTQCSSGVGKQGETQERNETGKARNQKQVENRNEKYE